ncbi:MAG: glycoside-pentoside-hexuronide (GPH):cation symporter [Clostridia bacterium]|nr:glycoside-pentoside-hexuronide (GPH):cation symporter [Clostridia bacterium]
MEKYVTKKEKFAFAFSSAGSYMIIGFVSSYLMIFFTDFLIVPKEFVFLLMAFARVWDMINDPIMGIIIDKTHTKYGKMRPYVLIGSIVIFITTILLFLPIYQAPMTTKMIYAAIMYIAFGMAYTLVDVPAMGLLSVATPNNKEMASLLSFYVTVGSVATVIPLGLLPVFTSVFPNKIYGYFAFAIFAAIITSAAYLNMYRHGKERCATQTEKISIKEMIKAVSKNKPMLLTLLASMIAGTRYLIIPAAMYVATYVIHIGNLEPETVTMVLSAIVGAGMFTGILLSPVLYKKYGYKKVCLASAFLGATFLGLAFFIGRINYYAALPLICLGGLALGSYNVLPYPMVGDSLDYLEWKTGQRMEGVCFSLNSSVTKFNNAIGFIGLSLGLILIKFIQPDVSGVPKPQSDSTVTGIYAFVTLIPAIGFLLSAIPMFFYDYQGTKKEQIQKELAERRRLCSCETIAETNPEEPVCTVND